MGTTLLASQLMYRGRAIGLRVDRMQLPDGQTADWEVVEHPGSVAVVPVDSAGRIWFVRQYRHSVAQLVLEVPAGTLHPGEDPVECAARELREEIGMAAGRMVELGGFFLAPGYSQEYMHIFLATGLSPSFLPMDPDESIEVEPIPAIEALAMARDGRLRDSKSLASLFLAEPALRLPSQSGTS